mmetsp:Transcript_36877/g.122255  ORF Transcript_36877/g.122255 Transcript_36877/m.122255 type:complete len:229 (+) Transcript_36877:110-796(+)|eukprot:CAMPEP_0202773652 /NCGR_PEP_ID=MMETSP1388-20130828/45012_1 /ASSEMBLY_ACC=CAM_ASM_000864 /TAXON_ID=37098 /ORGANISM="Isochrysis sp, Strain CCMP1244" /LENGTH=228 /DNA_ID=CAMNT_0049442677 /DNA_START=67 /DNA_END=753 /DNA_ORIENTATION=-
MVGVGYGKGATLPDEEVRWLTPEQVDGLRAGEGVRLLDARDAPEFQKASLPGAESLPQSTLMFSRGKVQALVDELVGSQAGELCFFANTAGPNAGMTAGREVYVMAFLLELGLPLTRMARLRGGLNGWVESGRPAPPAGREVAPQLPAVSGGLRGLCEGAGLGHLAAALPPSLTLEAAAAAATSSRQSFLASLRDEHGMSRLADRQALCNALSKAVREGRVPGRAEEG